MILIDNAVISDDLKESFFVCNLQKCKGACCVEGDLGAPLEEAEMKILKKIYPSIKPYLTEAGIKAIEEQGYYVKDFEGDYNTPTIDNRECAYATYDKNGILKCGIELAYLDGKIKFRKPISCHLYPIRIQKFRGYEMINYDRWDICDAACALGKELKVPLYKFLKEPLIRRFGQDWYDELVQEIEGNRLILE